MKKLKGILGVTTNVAVVVFAVVALGVLAKNHLAPRAAATQGGVPKGSTFPELAGADYKQARRTLVLALNVDCRYCTKSFPFYNRLAEAQREHAGRFGLVAAFINKDEDRVKSYVEEKQLAVRMTAGVDLDKLRITTTPTVVLLDEGGKVIDSWRGRAAVVASALDLLWKHEESYARANFVRSADGMLEKFASDETKGQGRAELRSALGVLLKAFARRDPQGSGRLPDRFRKLPEEAMKGGPGSRLSPRERLPLAQAGLDSDPAQSAALAGKVIESGAPGSFPEYLNEL